MQFLLLTRRRSEEFAEDAFTALLPDEAQGVRRLYIEGFIRQIFVRGDALGACLMVEAASEDAVLEQMRTLPIYGAGMLEIVSLVPLKPYPGFGPR